MWKKFYNRLPHSRPSHFTHLSPVAMGKHSPNTGVPIISAFTCRTKPNSLQVIAHNQALTQVAFNQTRAPFSHHGTPVLWVGFFNSLRHSRLGVLTYSPTLKKVVIPYNTIIIKTSLSVAISNIRCPCYPTLLSIT